MHSGQGLHPNMPVDPGAWVPAARGPFTPHPDRYPIVRTVMEDICNIIPERSISIRVITQVNSVYPDIRIHINAIEPNIGALAFL